jgi:superfamily II DNA or RNA helicase
MISLTRSGLLIKATGLPALVVDALKADLTYMKNEMTLAGGRPSFRSTPQEMWTVDSEGALVFLCGYQARAEALLLSYGLQVDEYARLDRTDELPYDLSQLSCSLRPEQERILTAIVSHSEGQCISPTGSGKTYGLGEACAIYKDARILLCAPGREAVGTMRNYLVDHFGDDQIGQLGGGRRFSRRITVATFDSMTKLDRLDEVDILFCDEGHKNPAPKYAKNIAAITAPLKRFMFTATPADLRADNAGLVAEGLFGPTLVDISYYESVAAGSILPLVVLAIDQPFGPTEVQLSNFISLADRDRLALWRNADRNESIARNIRAVSDSYGADCQSLVLVETLEHALVLSKLLPEYQVIHGQPDKRRRDRLGRAGLDISEVISDKERTRFKEEFEKGSLKKVIATSIMATGVSADFCQVVACASGRRALIGFIQSIGRTSRKSDRTNRTHGTVLVWRDRFANAYHKRSQAVISAARRQGHVVKETSG